MVGGTAQRVAGIATVVAAVAVCACAGRRVTQTTVTLATHASTPPRLVRQGSVQIPAELRSRACVSGVAGVAVEIGVTGRVEKAGLSRASGEPVFDEACVQSAFTWVYEPATSRGKPVAGVSHIECRLDCP
jgi:TonB family protein